MTRVRERDGTIRAEVLHVANASCLLEGLTLDDPGAPERHRLSAGEKMQRAAMLSALVDANRRWEDASAVGADTGRVREGSCRFAEPLVSGVIELEPLEAYEAGDAEACACADAEHDWLRTRTYIS